MCRLKLGVLIVDYLRFLVAVVRHVPRTSPCTLSLPVMLCPMSQLIMNPLVQTQYYVPTNVVRHARIGIRKICVDMLWVESFPTN